MRIIFMINSWEFFLLYVYRIIRDFDDCIFFFLWVMKNKRS